MKYTPKKVFILEKGKYIGIPYEEFNAAKTSAYETWGKDNILWLLFCELSKKQDLNCRLW